MSVIISGISKAENCLKCPLADKQNGDCLVDSDGRQWDASGATPEWCPLHDYSVYLKEKDKKIAFLRKTIEKLEQNSLDQQTKRGRPAR